MALTYERNDATRTLVVTVSGPFVVEDIVGVVDRQAAEDAWQYVLSYDERGMTSAPTPDDLRVLLKPVKKMVGTHGPRGPVAVITARQDLYGMARFNSTLSEFDRDRLHVFHNIADADRRLSQVTRARRRRNRR